MAARLVQRLEVVVLLVDPVRGSCLPLREAGDGIPVAFLVLLFLVLGVPDFGLSARHCAGRVRSDEVGTNRTDGWAENLGYDWAFGDCDAER